MINHGEILKSVLNALNLEPAILNRVVDSYNQSLTKIKDIVYKVDCVAVKRDAIQKKFKEDIDSLDKELSEVRKNCVHEQQSFNGDPAGGRDSYYSCNICGKAL